MISEHSAGAIIFFDNEKREFLIISNEKERWDFPKGHIEEGETPEQTAVREVKEETGLDIEFIDGFKEKISFFFKKDKELVKKDVIFFLAKAKSKKVTLSFEHIDYKWLNFEEALNKLTFKDSKNLLIKANQFLTNLG